jgi:hypothetical protein
MLALLHGLSHRADTAVAPRQHAIVRDVCRPHRSSTVDRPGALRLDGGVAAGARQAGPLLGKTAQRFMQSGGSA